MAAKSFVDKAIKDNKVIIFSKSYCPYCKKAKSALGSVIPSDKFHVVELDQRSDTDSLQDYLLEITGGRSVPRVFVDGQFIGGGDDTVQLAASGQLKQLLASKGIL
ncbi:hypothetical protein WJX73_003904 [Symbiochloris irregularis]|uniref:Glutaredoxin domain-containing protein n=1 Tax=Symbiochloris irregularis TaxID=706552 RepID=A0AAW1Q2H2_9CHLO